MRYVRIAGLAIAPDESLVELPRLGGLPLAATELAELSIGLKVTTGVKRSSGSGAISSDLAIHTRYLNFLTSGVGGRGEAWQRVNLALLSLSLLLSVSSCRAIIDPMTGKTSCRIGAQQIGDSGFERLF